LGAPTLSSGILVVNVRYEQERQTVFASDLSLPDLADRYTATLYLRKWEGFNNDLIPPKILEAAKISKPFEMLTIRLRKQAKPKREKK
jgi:hypothetical protein